MERTIKFRGRRFDNDKWIFGDLRHRTTPTTRLFINNRDDIAVDPDTVGQFTGFFDKNCKEIYEDDIVWWQGNMYVVRFLHGAFYGIDEAGYKCLLARMTHHSYLHKEDACKIVANIHDNPDFLEDYHGSKES